MKAHFLPHKIGFAAALLLLPAASVLAQDSYENDDYPEYARPIGNGQAQKHTFHVEDDVDWVVFTIGANGATNFRGETREARVEGWLYGPNSASRLISHNRTVEPSLAPGTYYLAVAPYSWDDEDDEEQEYILQVSWIENASPPDRFEPDDTAATAKPIANGEAQNRSVHAPIDIDWVTFTIGPDGASDFRAETEGGEGDSEMWLLGPNSSTRQIVYNDNGPTGLWSLITQATLGPGTYYLYIQSKNNKEALFYYTLRASWTNNVPRVTKQPASQAVAAGTTVVFSIEASPGPWVYQWYKDGTPLRDGARVKGVGSPTLTLTETEGGDTGAYSVRVSGVTGQVSSEPAQLAVTSLDRAGPTISQHPTHQSTAVGQGATFTVVARGSAPLGYQWEYLPRGSLTWGLLTDGARASGARTPTLTIGDALLDMNGDAFRCIVSNALGSATSNAAVLVVNSGTSPASWLSNISILASLAAPGDRLTLGYVVGGGDPKVGKPLLVRAAGPSLAALGATGAIPDPKLEIFAGSASAGENDNWGGGSALNETFASVGAFPYAAANSRDAALLVSRPAGNNTVRVSGVGDAVGLVLAEIYDATPAFASTAATPRLINLSVLHEIAGGLTAGFVIAGNGSKTLLIRAAGPTLGAPPFNLPGTAADPQLNLYLGAALVASDDDWEAGNPGDTAAAARLSATAARVGAFGFPAGGKDAALLVTLQPGNYTVRVTAAGNDAGLGLLEIYEVE
jgi:hypothetical protein